MRGDLAYVGEDCWLQSTTIRDNIVFGLEFNKNRYVKACIICDLEADFQALVNWDMTKIGDQGIQLTSSQKIRISLARAIYSRPDIVLLEKIFNSLDTLTASTIFE